MSVTADNRNRLYLAGVGAGNPSGLLGRYAYYDPLTTIKGSGKNGTGGLLIIVSNKLVNAGKINSNGISGESNEAAGGSSGGGSINIFYKENYTNTGVVDATGGLSANAYKRYN